MSQGAPKFHNVGCFKGVRLQASGIGNKCCNLTRARVDAKWRRQPLAATRRRASLRNRISYFLEAENGRIRSWEDNSRPLNIRQRSSKIMERLSATRSSSASRNGGTFANSLSFRRGGVKALAEKRFSGCWPTFGTIQNGFASTCSSAIRSESRSGDRSASLIIVSRWSEKARHSRHPRKTPAWK